MIQESALVSVIIPTYNRAHLIGETLQSVLSQTYSHWELLIIDDGSTDKTQSAIAKYADSRIHYFRFEHSGFIGKIKNYGIRKSKGDLIAFLDSDDIWRADKLEFQVALFDKHPEAAFIFSNGDQFGEGAIMPPEKEELYVGNVFLPMLVQSRFCFFTPSLIFRKEVIDEIGLLDEKISTTRDIHFFYRMSHKYTGIFTNQRLVKIRKHSQNTSAMANVESHHNYLTMLKEFHIDGIISTTNFRKLSSICHYKLGLVHYHNRNAPRAFRSFLKYILVVPWHWKGWARMLQVSWRGLATVVKGAPRFPQS
jgi:glycosyltransferase involved in cell wall biosynthesis